MDRGSFIRLDAGDWRPLGHEAAAAGRDHDHAGDDLGFQRGRHFAEMEGRTERLDLFHQPFGQFLAADDGKTGNVVDRLFRIELGALPARTVEDVDQMGFEIQESKLEDGKKAGRPGPYNRGIGFDRRGHFTSDFCMNSRTCALICKKRSTNNPRPGSLALTRLACR